MDNERNHEDKLNRIRELAYLKWIKSNSPEGNGINFWLEAESEYQVAESYLTKINLSLNF